MTSLATSAELAQTTALLYSLWPDWSPTDPERDLFHAKLASLQQLQVREALKLAYEERYTARPSLAHVMIHYRKMAPPPPREFLSKLRASDDDASMRRSLAVLDHDGISASISFAAAQMGWSADACPDPEHIDDWSSGTVGMVWVAAADLELVR